MTTRVILVVDDDEDLCSEIVDYFSLYGDEFRALCGGTARAAIEAVKAGVIDLIVMDVGLPDMDGRDAVKILRRRDYKAPIIMLTGRTADADTILAFEAGADDYVTKPFHFPVLLARIRAQLRRYEQTEEATFHIGPFTFKPGKRFLLNERGRKIRLTAKETGIIKYLYNADRKVVRREELLKAVWGYNSMVSTHTLESHVYRLRQKIENDPSNAAFLVTEGGGYRLSF